MTQRRFGPSTLAIHGIPNRRPDWAPVAPPLVQSSTFSNPVGSEEEVSSPPEREEPGEPTPVPA